MAEERQFSPSDTVVGNARTNGGRTQIWSENFVDGENPGHHSVNAGEVLLVAAVVYVADKQYLIFDGDADARYPATLFDLHARCASAVA